MDTTRVILSKKKTHNFFDTSAKQRVFQRNLNSLLQNNSIAGQTIMSVGGTNSLYIGGDYEIDEQTIDDWLNDRDTLQISDQNWRDYYDNYITYKITDVKEKYEVSKLPTEPATSKNKQALVENMNKDKDVTSVLHGVDLALSTFYKEKNFKKAKIILPHFFNRLIDVDVNDKIPSQIKLTLKKEIQNNFLNR